MGEGFETYRAFAPEGWEPPDRLELALGLVMRLPDPDWWCLIASDAGAVAGHVAFMPAAKHRWPAEDPSVAHLLQLFVRPTSWGGGVAKDLHDRALGEAAGRGYTSMRLFCAEGQTRARRFYEREGWKATGAARFEPGIGLEIIEMSRDL